jgi:putative flippase GtrA
MPKLQPLLRYLVAGAGNTAATFALYAALVMVGVDYQLANAIGWVFGLMNAYVLGRWFVFREARAPVRSSSQFVQFAIVHVASYALSAFLLLLLVGNWGWDKIAAQAIVIPAVVLVNFTASKYLVFRST